MTTKVLIVRTFVFKRECFGVKLLMSLLTTSKVERGEHRMTVNEPSKLRATGALAMLIRLRLTTVVATERAEFAAVISHVEQVRKWFNRRRQLKEAALGRGSGLARK
jgi:hypothetical protein